MKDENDFYSATVIVKLIFILWYGLLFQLSQLSIIDRYYF